MDRTIVAMGGGGFLTEPENPLLDDYILGLSGTATPRVCFIPTATGDAESVIERFYAAFPGDRADASHLALVQREIADVRAHLLAQDVIYVAGGNTVLMLAAWRAFGVDAALRDAWAAGVVLCGPSAGGLCWFEGGTTDSYGTLAGLSDGLGLLAGTFCPHYDGEAERRPLYRRLVAGGFPAGYAADDGAALHFTGTELREVVTSLPAARAYRVEAQTETPLEVRYLGA